MSAGYPDPRLANSTTGIYLQRAFNIEPRVPRCFPGVNMPKTYNERLRMGLDCDEVYPGIIIGEWGFSFLDFKKISNILAFCLMMFCLGSIKTESIIFTLF